MCASCVKRHGSGGAANHVVVKGSFWFYVVNGHRGHRGPRVIGSGFSRMPVKIPCIYYTKSHCILSYQNVPALPVKVEDNCISYAACTC